LETVRRITHALAWTKLSQ